MIQNQLVGAPIGENITLECISEAFPKSINYWMRSSRNDSIIVSGKYIVDLFGRPKLKCEEHLQALSPSLYVRQTATSNVLNNYKVENTKRALALRAFQSVFMHETRELNLIFIILKREQHACTAKGQAHGEW